MPEGSRSGGQWRATRRAEPVTDLDDWDSRGVSIEGDEDTVRSRIDQWLAEDDEHGAVLEHREVSSESSTRWKGHENWVGHLFDDSQQARQWADDRSDPETVDLDPSGDHSLIWSRSLEVFDDDHTD